MKAKTIKTLQQCPRLAYWQNQNLDSAKGFKLKAAMAVRSIFQEMDMDEMTDYYGVKDRLEDLIDHEFVMNREREENFDLLTKQINRMANFFKTNQFKKCDDAEQYGTIKIGNYEEIKVSRDLVVEKDGIVYSVKLKMSKADYTIKSGSSKHPGNDMDNYLVHLAFPNTVPAIYALKKDKETTDNFDPNVSINVIMYKNWFPVTEFDKNLHYELIDLLSIQINQDAACNEAECERCFYKNICKYNDIDTKLEPIEAPVKKSQPLWTPNQKNVIDFSEGEAHVIAGAGSGKTSVLVNRMIRLANLEENPKKILAITFTEKGVREIRLKLDQFLRKDTDLFLSKDFEVYTFNSFGYEFIKKNFAYCGFTEEPRLIDESHKTEVLAKILDNNPKILGLNYTDPFMMIFKVKGAVPLFKDIIDLIKRKNAKTLNEICNVLELQEGQMRSIAFLDARNGVYNLKNVQTIKDCYDQYQDYLLKNNLVEYQDQINITLKALNEHPELHDQYINMYKHIIIDEFQDTSADQMELVNKHLYKAEPNRSLMVCGDDAQSIFSFRDVDVKNILEFQKVYPDSKSFKMLENFRSTQEILDVANTIIKFNANRIDKNLYSVRHGSKPEIKVGDLDDCFQTIKQLVDNGEDLREIAFLARTRIECYEMHKMLSLAGIDNVVVISHDVKDDNQVQAMIALAKFLDDRNVDEQRLMEGGIWLRKSNNKLFESQFIQQDYILNESNALLNEFSEVEDEEKYNWFIKKVSDTFADNPSIALMTLLEHEENEKDKSFHRLCDYLLMIDNCNTGMTAESDDRVYNAVTVSTIHAAKGREWTNVVCSFARMKKGKFVYDESSKKDVYTYDPEEIRLAFVAITRAKANLFVYGKSEWIDACNGNVVKVDRKTKKNKKIN